MALSYDTYHGQLTAEKQQKTTTPSARNKKFPLKRRNSSDCQLKV